MYSFVSFAFALWVPSVTPFVFTFRYNPNKGLLTLTSEKYREREENRLHVVEMLTGLVKEGQRAYPSDTFKEDLDYFADESAAEAATA